MDNEAESSDVSGDANLVNSGSLLEEEKVEVAAPEAGVSDGVGPVKTSEDDNDLNASDVYQTQQTDATVADGQDANQELIASKGTIAEIPRDDSAVFESADEERRVVPGFMFVAGPDYTGTGILTGYTSDPDGDTIQMNNVILEGFLPEDDPSRRRSRQESAEDRIQRLIDNAITLDDSAVRPIPMEDENYAGEGRINGDGSDDSESLDDDSKSLKTDYFRCFLLLMAVCVVMAIVLPLSLGTGKRKGANSSSQDTKASFDTANCLAGDLDARYELAKTILSDITSPEVLEDGSTVQGRAIRWIVCDDLVSVQLFENQDTSTGKLPKQMLVFPESGDSGEAQILRRYILVVFFYSTSQVNLWADSLNFLSPELHECSWYRNVTRQNFPYGDFDPVGIVCQDFDYNLITADQGHEPPLDGEDSQNVRYFALNFRIDNDINGPLPPEIGHLVDCEALALENNIRLSGSIPQTIGNMTRLHSFSLILNGISFGGELPDSLFQLKQLNYIHVQDNLGKEWSLPSNVQVNNDTQLERLVLVRNSFTGNIPSWLGELSRLKTLDLSYNSFQGAIPEAIGALSSLKYLNFMGNDLTHSIPSSVGNLPQIEVLNLGKNKLVGGLPASIGNLRTLLLLDVGSNELTSTVPSSYAELESLKYLVLESNKLSGSLDVLESMRNLTVLLIRSNSFSGVLPDGLFSEATDNVVVDIGDNSLTGWLPSGFANNMTNLVTLIGTKNAFADDSATTAAVCDKATLMVMDCESCECCEVCCDGENEVICDFQLDVETVLGYYCGAWFAFCLQGPDDFAGVLY